MDRVIPYKSENPIKDNIDVMNCFFNLTADEKEFITILVSEFRDKNNSNRDKTWKDILTSTKGKKELKKKVGKSHALFKYYFDSCKSKKAIVEINNVEQVHPYLSSLNSKIIFEFI